MKRTIEQTALLVALLLKRSEERRARISEKTIRRLSRRKPLRDAFKESLRSELDDLGVHLVQLDVGGFGAIWIDALNGAPRITAKKYLEDDLKKLKKGDEDEFFAELREELEKCAEGYDEAEEDDL